MLSVHLYLIRVAVSSLVSHSCRCQSVHFLFAVYRSAKKVGRKVLYLFTNAASQYSDDQLDLITAGLKNKEIDLIIV